ncbi:methionyl-tRNA formyltransferase [Candidatus Omnitrophota bacterium]
MNIILFASPGILGPNMFASLCRRGREKVACLVLPLKQHSIGNDDLLTIAHYAQVPYCAPRDLTDPEFIKKIKDIAPDIFLVASYDTKLPRELLNIPKLAAVNIHPSLLPCYRGACPEFWAIRHGDTKTGVTLHELTERFDDGPILLQKEVFILPQETLGSLLYKLSNAAFEVACQFLDSVHREESLPRYTQDESQVTYAPLVSADDLEIDWKDKSSSIINLIRAANPLGGAWSLFRGFHLKIWYADMVDFPELQGKYDNANPGTLIPLSHHQKLLVTTGDGLIELRTLQYALFYIIDGWGFVTHTKISSNECLSVS